MEKELEQGISLGEIFHVIFIKKWLFLGVSLGIMILGLLFITVFYNPRAISYNMVFDITFPGISEGLYPDGKRVNFNDFVSEELLLNVQATDEDFASIDIETLCLNNGITVFEEEEEINQDTIKTGYLVLSADAPYFEDDTQARKFIISIVKYICDYAIKANNSIDLKYNLKKFTDVASYDEKVTYLINQKNLILNGYNSIINNFSNAYTINGVNILDAKSEVEAYFSYVDLDALRTEIEMNGYFDRDSDLIYSIKNSIDTLKREKELNLLKIEMYEQERDALLIKMKDFNLTDTQFNVLESYNNSILSLKSRNLEIDYKIEVEYKPYLDASENQTPEYIANLANFEERLDEYYQKLLDYTNKYIPYDKLAFEEHTYITYKNASKVTSNGGIGLIVSLVLSLFLGLMVASCLNLCLDMPKYLKNKKEKLDVSMKSNDSLDKLDE